MSASPQHASGEGPRVPAVGDRLHGFVVQRVEDLPEIDGKAVVMRHEAAGTPLLWLANDDANKSFAIAFKTPPADDTGVFHILEHSVLCGSDRYPVKEPFVNLLKTSMQTFLNALTFADKTMYPVASTNEQDLLNLMDVYMDAVFHPCLYHKPTVFEQEGWHLELDDPDGALRYNGVVLNEMKGALSDPDDFALQALNRALFPDTAYGFESGGNPRAIPTLTYESYVDTHRRHYNARNARIVLYGDLDVARELALLDERYLRDAAEPAGEPNPLALQAPVVNLGATCTMDTTPDNACVMLGYVVGTYAQRREVLAADVLVDALMGSNEAPLKKRLLDAGLGSDVDAFLYDGLLQPYVVFELRGARPGVVDAFRETLEGAVAELVRDGIPRAALEASLESLSFELRERDYGYADGVALAVHAMNGWLYDDEMPVDYLRYEDDLAALRQTRFEDALDRLVTRCAHKAQVTLVPSSDEASSPAAQEAAELARRKAAMTPAQVARTIEHTRELHALQAAPDTPEQLATLPRLGREDIGPAPHDPAFELVDGATVPYVYHAVPTRRIDYVQHYFDLSHLSYDELPAVTLLGSLLGKLGTARHDASELDTLLEARLGRLTFGAAVHLDEATGEPVARMAVGTSAIEENLDSLVDLPSEVWSSTDFTDLARIRTILEQQRLNLEQGFAASGHTYALGRALTYVSPLHRLAQRFGGIDYYRYVRDLLDHFDERAADLPARLADLAARVFVREGALSSFAGTRGDCDRFWAHADEGGLALGSLSAEERGRRLVIPAPTVANEAFVVPTDVCFVAKADDAAHAQVRYSGAWEVASRALSYGYLWDEVRVQGGAYGCGFRVRPDGCVGYYTYRDAHLDETLARLDAAGGWLASFAPTESELTGYVVSTVAGHDAPLRPRAVAIRQDADVLTHRDPAWRDRVRQEELDCRAEQLRALAPALDRLAARDAVCVFGSRQIIESAKTRLDVVDLLG